MNIRNILESLIKDETISRLEHDHYQILKWVEEGDAELTKFTTQRILLTLEELADSLGGFADFPIWPNVVAYHLKVRWAHNISFFSDSINRRLDDVMKKVAEQNQSMVSCHYLDPVIISQKAILKNPAYVVLETDNEYENAYAYTKVEEEEFMEEVPRNGLDRRVDFTDFYLDGAKDLILFLAATQNQVWPLEENKLFLSKFVQPVKDAIAKYRKTAKNQTDKIAAYKEISIPLQNLTTEMYKHAVKVYPNLPKPEYFQPEAEKQIQAIKK